MEVFGLTMQNTAYIFAGAILASALVQWVFRRKVNWLRAFALSFGLLSGVAAVNYFNVSGAPRILAIFVWIASLVAVAEHLSKLKLKNMPNHSLKRTDQSLRD